MGYRYKWNTKIIDVRTCKMVRHIWNIKENVLWLIWRFQRTWRFGGPGLEMGSRVLVLNSAALLGLSPRRSLSVSWCEQVWVSEIRWVGSPVVPDYNIVLTFIQDEPCYLEIGSLEEPAKASLFLNHPPDLIKGNAHDSTGDYSLEHWYNYLP
jgi:hypothetical protein